MDLTDSIEPVTTLKTRSAELIRRARDSGQPIVITQNGKATAVLQDVESYERQREALLLLKYLARGDRDIREGKRLRHAQVKKRIARKLRTGSARRSSEPSKAWTSTPSAAGSCPSYATWGCATTASSS